MSRTMDESKRRSINNVIAKLREAGLSVHSPDDEIKNALKHTASPIACWRAVELIRKEMKDARENR